VIVIDSSRQSHSAVHQGVAFWVQKRLVGSPSWTVGQAGSFDGRTRFSRRYNVVVDTEGYEAEVEPDWRAFRDTEAVRELHKKTVLQIAEVAQRLAAEVVEESSADALLQHKHDLERLGHGARLEVAKFTKTIAEAHPTIAPEFLSAAVKAVINLEKSKSGVALLQRLSSIAPEDVEGLNRILQEWTVSDALRVLDEIGSRLSVLETIARLANDPSADELHTLHPLVLRSRWLFGPEFESDEFCSNATLRSIAERLFGKPDAKFLNDRRRPDIVVLPDGTTCQLTGIEGFDPAEPELVRMSHVLLIELKRGGSQLTRKEVSQSEGYVDDIAASGVLRGTPFISAWVVGYSIAPAVGRDKLLRTESGDTYGRVRATTFSNLVDTANRRLFRLKEILVERYADLPTDRLLARVFSTPEQGLIDFPEARFT